MHKVAVPQGVRFLLASLPAVLSVFVSLSAQRAERNQILDQIEARAKRLHVDLSERLESQVLSLVRMAKHLERQGVTQETWQSETELLFKDLSSYLNIILTDERFRVRWTSRPQGENGGERGADAGPEARAAPPVNEGFDLAFSAERRSTLERARDQNVVAASPVFTLLSGEKGFLVPVAIYIDKRFLGHLVGYFQVDRLVAPIVDDPALSDFGVTVFENGRPVFISNVEPYVDADRWTRGTTVGVYGQTWVINVWPSKAQLKRMRSNIPVITLSMGFMASALIAVSLVFAQRASERQDDAERASARLREQMRERDEALKLVSERQYWIDQIASTAPSLIYVYDAKEHRNLYSSAAIYRILGMSPEELLRSEPYFIEGRMHPDDRQRVDEGLQRVLSLLEGEFHEMEYRILHNDGAYRWVSDRSTVFKRDNKGEVEQFIGVVVDITERKRAESELKTNEETLRLLHEISADPTLAFADRLQRLIAVGCQRFGLEEGAILEAGDGEFTTLIAAPDGPSARVFARSLAFEEWFCSETYFSREPIAIESASRSGWQHHPAYLVHRVESYFGTPLKVSGRDFGTLAFVSRQPHDEPFSPSAKEFLKVLAQWIAHEMTQNETEVSLQQTRDIAVAATRAKSEFLANVSHEIRTPMNAVVNLARILLDMDHTSEQRPLLETIQSSGDLLLTIINDILDFSRLEFGRLEIVKTSFDLEACINTVVSLLAPKAAEKGLNMFLSVEPDVPGHVISDPARVQQILTNLVGNAIKFTSSGNVEINVSLSARSADEPPRPTSGEATSDTAAGTQVVIVFSVIDTGIGIPHESIARLFKPFSQVDTSISRRYGGTGLGLAISKQLAELLGGRLWAESAPGHGSTFSFTLPAERSDAPIETIEADRPGLRDVPHELRILLAEDNLVNQQVALLLLSRLGYSAEVATNGVQAFEAVKKQTFDVVLMDIQMPEMDGIEATRRIRAALPSNARPVIIAMTANVLQGDREKCLSAGMDGYLGKPIRLEELARTLESARARRIGRKAASSGGAPTPESEGAFAFLNARPHAELDPKALALLAGFGGPKVVMDVLKVFLDGGAARVDSIQRGLKDLNAATLEREFHSCKSAAKYVGASRLAQLSEHLEELAARKQVAQIDALLGDFLSQHRAALDEMEFVLTELHKADEAHA